MRELLIEKWILPTEIYESGTMIWRNESWEIHSCDDRPAVIYASGTKWWYKNGERHRDGDKPAVIFADGEKRWYKNGKFIKEEN